MKNIIIKHGLIAGVIVTSVMIICTLVTYQNPDNGNIMWLGFASMLVAFSFIFSGIKNYRDTYNGGIVTFGQAFKIGLLIAFFASSLYVVVWLVEYYLFIPDFMEKYTAYELNSASPEELPKKTEDMAKYTEMYKSPLMIVLFTYSEILPMGILISLISALVLKRKVKVGSEAV